MNVLLLAMTGAPMAVIPERRAWSLLARGRAAVAHVAEGQPWRAAGGAQFPRPSVVYLTRPAPLRLGAPRWTRREVLARDGHRCAYCGAPARTVDHIHPRHLCRAEGRNPDTWENTAAACEGCQRRKGGQPLALSGLRFRPGFAPRVPHRGPPSFQRVVLTRPEWRAFVPEAWGQTPPG